jgi:hypothetical protein
MRPCFILLGLLVACSRGSGSGDPSGAPRAGDPARPAPAARPAPRRPTFLGFHLGQPEADCRSRVASQFTVAPADGLPAIRARIAGLDLSLDPTYTAGVLTRLQARWERAAAGTPRSSPVHAEIAREWGRDGVCNEVQCEWREGEHRLLLDHLEHWNPGAPAPRRFGTAELARVAPTLP